jgi:hypothetical protein
MPSPSSSGKRSGKARMASRSPRMIRPAAYRGPRMQVAVQDRWTAIGPARTIIQDQRGASWTTDRGLGRPPAARTTWEAWR